MKLSSSLLVIVCLSLAACQPSARKGPVKDLNEKKEPVKVTNVDSNPNGPAIDIQNENKPGNDDGTNRADDTLDKESAGPLKSFMSDTTGGGDLSFVVTKSQSVPGYDVLVTRYQFKDRNAKTKLLESELKGTELYDCLGKLFAGKLQISEAKIAPDALSGTWTRWVLTTEKDSRFEIANPVTHNNHCSVLRTEIQDLILSQLKSTTVSTQTSTTSTTAPVTTAPVTTAPVTTAPVTTAPVTTAPATTTTSPPKLNESPVNNPAVDRRQKTRTEPSVCEAVSLTGVWQYTLVSKKITNYTRDIKITFSPLKTDDGSVRYSATQETLNHGTLGTDPVETEKMTYLFDQKNCRLYLVMEDRMFPYKVMNFNVSGGLNASGERELTDLTIQSCKDKLCTSLQTEDFSQTTLKRSQ